MKKKNKRKLFDDKRIVLVSSFLLAVLSWVIVAGFINPGQTNVIANIRIDYTRNESAFTGKNLQIVSDQKDAAFADVQVSGDGSEISGLQNTDVTVYPDYSAVRGPGEYVIPLKAERVTGGDYIIDAVSVKNSVYSLSRNPPNPSDTITITFEEVASKMLPVTVKADNITAAPGYFKDAPTASQAEVTVTGPKSAVDRVAQVVAEVNEEEELSEPVIFSSVPLQLMDSSGNVVESDMLTVAPVEMVEVDIQILELRTIDLTLGFSGIPQGFDTDWLNSLVHLSPTTLQVAGTQNAFLSLQDPYPIGVVDISQMSVGWESDPIPITLPSGIESHDQISQVVASLDSTTLKTKTFEVTTFVTSNRPQNLSISPNADVMTVTLVGEADQIDALLPENITIQIEAFGVTAAKGGQQSIPARILVPGANRVFATGHYSVVCDVAVETNAADS